MEMDQPKQTGYCPDRCCNLGSAQGHRNRSLEHRTLRWNTYPDVGLKGITLHEETNQHLLSNHRNRS